MQVFNAFMKVLKKNLPTVIIWVAIFLSISIIVSKSGSENSEFKSKVLNVCVFDEDNTESSRAFRDFIASKHNVYELENDDDRILDELFYETKDYVITIKKGFSENLSNGITEGLFDNRYVHESYSNVLMTNLADEYVKTVRAFLAKGDDLSTAQKNAADTLSLNVEVTKETFKEDHIYSDDYSALFSAYFQYLPYVFLQILVSALCPVLLTMNKKNIRNRTNCSSIRPSSQTFQIFLGSMIFVLGLWLLFMISGALLNEEFYRGRALLAMLNSFVFILISTGIAILIASFNPGRVGVNVLSNIISLGMCFLCGIFVPQEVLSDSVLSAARFLPAYWYIRVNNMLSGVSGEIFSSSLCMKFIGIEVLFALAIFAAALTVTKIRHDKA